VALPAAQSPDAEAPSPRDVPVTPRPTSPRVVALWAWVLPCLLVLLVVAAFFPALLAGYVAWDDEQLVLGNLPHLTLDADGVRWMWETRAGGHFQPLTWVTYAVDRVLWPDLTFGLHCSNVLLHTLAALTFYFVARRLLGLALPEQSAHSPVAWRASAACAAALFAVHPLRVESVAWIAERRDVLSAFLYLLSVLCYVKYASGKAPPMLNITPLPPGGEGRVRGETAATQPCIDASAPRSGDAEETPGFADQPTSQRESALAVYGCKTWYILAVVLCAVSLLAKASALTLTGVLLVLDVYPLRRLGGRRGWFTADAGRVWLEKLPFLLLGLWAAERALAAQAAAGALYTLQQYGPWSRLAQATQGLAFYIGKMLLPVNLGPIYQIPPPDVLLGGRLWASAVVVVILIVTGVALRRRWPGVPAALAAYVIILAPVLGFAQSGPQLVADRYSYLSCLGFALLAGGVVLTWYRRTALPPLPPGGEGRVRGVGRDASASAQPPSATPSRASNSANAPTVTPLPPGGEGRVSGEPATALPSAGPAASPQSRRAVGALVIALVVFVLIHATMRQAAYWADAETLWARAVTVSPESSFAHANYADALALRAWATGAENGATALERALHHYRRALQLDRFDPVTADHFARTLALGGSTDAAVTMYQWALRLKPDSVATRASLADLLAGTGQPAAAVQVLRDGLDRDSASQALLDPLARLLATHPDAAIRDGTEAVRWARLLMATRPEPHAPVLLTLATALAEAGQFEEAVAAAQEALALAEAAEDDRFAELLRRRLELFRAGKPYHVELPLPTTDK